MEPPTGATSAIGSLSSSIFNWRCMSAAALTLLVYEYSITFNAEVSFVWRRPGRSFKVLWALLRYPIIISFAMYNLSAFASPSPLVTTRLSRITMTVPWQATSVLLTFLSLVAGHLLFILRTYALYLRARIVLIICGPLFVAEVVMTLYTICSQLSEIAEYHNTVGDMDETPFDEAQKCVPGAANNCGNIWLWAFPFLLDSTITIFTLRRSWLIARQEKRTPLLHVLVRDDVLYFVVDVMFCITAITMAAARPAGSQLEYTLLPVVLMAIMSTRLALNIRQMGCWRPTGSQASQGSGNNSILVLTNLNEIVDQLGITDWSSLQDQDAEGNRGNPPETPEARTGKVEQV